jgi:hypothetical protein
MVKNQKMALHPRNWAWCTLERQMSRVKAITYEYPSHNRSYRWAQKRPSCDKSEILASLRDRSDVRNNPTGEGNCATAARALDAPKHEKSRIIVLQSQADVGADVDDKTYCVCRTSASAVCEIANNRRRKALEDLDTSVERKVKEEA